jgi:hypothetical protein
MMLANIHAQTCDFTINTVVTPSSCQSNGMITVTLGGDTTGLSDKKYSLQSSVPGGFSLPPTSSSVLTGIPPGTYTVTVTAFCTTLNGYTDPKVKQNVVVGGNYVVPQLSFVAAGRTNTAATVAPTSRKSYKGCSTGKIVLKLTNGNQTANPVFTITSAPSGVAVPQTVNVTRYTTGSLTAGYTYTLDGLYPAGDYTVQVDDGCYTAAISFNLGELTDVPNPNGESSTTMSYSDIYPYLDGNNPGCSLIKVALTTPATSNPDFYQYYRDTLYEVGVAPLGQTPVNWVNWTYGVTQPVINLSPNQISDFYSTSANTMSVYFRMKDCPSVQERYDTYIYTPYLSSYYLVNNCDNYAVRRYTSSYYGVFCYPVEYKVERVSDGTVVYSESNITNFTGQLDTLMLEYGVQYRYTITDQSGYQLTATYSQSFTNYTSSTSSDIKECDYWQNYYYRSTANNCFPVYVTIKNGNTVVALDTIRASSDPLYNSTTNLYSPNLDYSSQTYTFEFTYPNRIVNGIPYTGSYSKTVASGRPTNITLSIYNYYYYEECSINTGSLYITTGNSSSQWPTGTVITIEGPAPFGTKSYTMNSPSYYNYIYSVPIPPGNYTMTVDFGCGTPLVSTVNLPGIYDVQNFTYTTENTCSGMKVTPSGMLTHYGTAAPIYYRLVSGPAGYDASVKTSGGSFTFSLPGTYVLGVIVANSSTQCALKTDTIVYTAPPMELDLNKTAAYACVGSNIGNIILQAKNGVTPYTYELWNRNNTTQLLPPVTSSDRVTFQYGFPDSTYTVRVTDACNNSFPQQITIADLETAKIVFSQANPVCYGDDMQITCLTLGETTYNWTGPNGYTSKEQNPVIHNADTTDAGWYFVSVNAEFCGIPVRDSIYMSVYPPIDMKEYADDTLYAEFCPRELIVLGKAATGGSGNFTYQWAHSTNGTTWASITTGGTVPVFSSTNTSYMFTSTAANPTYTRFRCTITDAKCGSFNVYYRTSAKPCMFPVNPDLMNLPEDSPLQRQKLP